MPEEPEERVYLESGDLAYETGISGTYIRHLVKSGVIHPAARTPRGVRLYEPSTVMTIKDWLNASQFRASERKKKKAEALELNQDHEEPKD